MNPLRRLWRLRLIFFANPKVFLHFSLQVLGQILISTLPIWTTIQFSWAQLPFCLAPSKTLGTNRYAMMTLTSLQSNHYNLILKVSWIRASDAHILTVDHEVFISDPRFSTIHQPNSSTWTLQIK